MARPRARRECGASLQFARLVNATYKVAPRFDCHRPPLQCSASELSHSAWDVFCFSENPRRDVNTRSTSADDGWVAQLAEQRTENPRVGGSIPPPATPPFS